MWVALLQGSDQNRPRLAKGTSEAEVVRMSDEILAAIAAKHGIDSYEYEVASGKRPIGRKRPGKKKTKSRAKPQG